MDIGERLKKWRKDNKLTMVQISQITGIAQSAISSYERGDTTISVKSLVLLMEHFDMDIVWILTGKSEDMVLTEEEKELIRFYRNCNQEGKTAVKTTATALSLPAGNSSELSTSKTG